MLPNWIYYFLGRNSAKSESGGGGDTPTKIVLPNGTKFAYSSALPENFSDKFDTSQITEFNKFLYYSYITELPEIDSSNATTFREFLSYNSRITTIPKLELNASDYNSMFNRCTNLTNLSDILLKSNSDSIDTRTMFGYCSSLESVPTIKIINDSTNEMTLLCETMFQGCSNLKTINLSFEGNFVCDGNYAYNNMFDGCTNLESGIPVFNFYTRSTSVSYFSNMFRNCTKLDDTSLDNILQSCISATQLGTYARKLSRLGITDSNLLARIPNLPHYQDFINAGWTIS